MYSPDGGPQRRITLTRAGSHEFEPEVVMDTDARTAGRLMVNGSRGGKDKMGLSGEHGDLDFAASAPPS